MEKSGWCFVVVSLALGLAILFVGCGAETNNPLAVQAVGGTPPKFESALIDLDARGFINGIFQPGGTTKLPDATYPISYTGDWKLIKVNTVDGHYMAMSASQGARLDITASLSRVIIDFWSYEMYQDPGRVRFELDGKPIGNFDLAGAVNNFGKINDYQITTGKTDVSTISMILESGRVVVCGYVLVFPDTRNLK